MRVLSLVILIGFISLSVFGVLGMLPSGMQEGSTCLASLAQNGACPPPEHTFASALFHASALKVFSTAFLSLVVSLALLYFGFFVSFLQETTRGANIFVCRLFETISGFLIAQKLRPALARLEHSPVSA